MLVKEERDKGYEVNGVGITMGKKYVKICESFIISDVFKFRYQSKSSKFIVTYLYRVLTLFYVSYRPLFAIIKQK
jgi:hypothetical protein